MPYFHYKAVNIDGSTVNGLINALDMDSVYTLAETSGRHIISVKPANAYLASLLSKYRSTQVKRRDIIEFSNNLSVMIRAGIPILSALMDIIDTTENRYFRENIESIRNNVSMGASFSDACGLHGDIFPDIFIRLVTVGEETGNLDGNLSDAADHLQRMEDLSSTIKRAMVYPVFAFVTALGALIFWLVYVLPKIMKIFEDMKVQLPLITKGLILTSNLTQRYWPFILITPLFLFILIKFLKRYKKPEFFFDKIKLGFPILKLILVNRILGLFTEQMRILLKAGLTIDRSFELVSEVIGNVVYKEAIIKAKDEVIAGASISAALRNQNIFTAMLLRMVHIGEASGTLEGQFSFLSEFYLKKLDDMSQRLGRMIEPVIIIFLGLMFAIMIIGLLLPIYDLVSKMGAM
ncbi:type II secretion system protein F [bacterium BMS3Abin07]|nr:type II secretion system protein F [bacterium BMS3Abin07]GBE31763.1 type II secretion system protein F [bacterium BMS3Bbin05]HDL20080.1 type II secretion system F family protein [Nitrospirota bacterium]HDO23497.1 type II secretion system F family protein [Nitrospirota bacterium]HDZ88639.1 type II secretion system F family protein [Nitrospirota bacterium]